MRRYAQHINKSIVMLLLDCKEGNMIFIFRNFSLPSILSHFDFLFLFFVHDDTANYPRFLIHTTRQLMNLCFWSNVIMIRSNKLYT